MIWVQYVVLHSHKKMKEGIQVCLFANRQGTSSIDSGDSVISICCK